MKTIITIVVLLLTAHSVESYNYKWKEIDIKVPENIQIYEYRLNTGNCSMKEYGCKVAYLNIYLIKKWFNPIY